MGVCVHEAAHAVIPAAAIERAIGNAYCRPRAACHPSSEAVSQEAGHNTNLPYRQRKQPGLSEHFEWLHVVRQFVGYQQFGQGSRYKLLAGGLQTRSFLLCNSV